MIQRYEFEKRNQFDENQFVEVWADTAWETLKEARRKFPGERYRQVTIKKEK